MAFINYATKHLAIKIVYYGPGLSGKTTNIRHIYSKVEPKSRGDLICLETPLERTLFFDLLPIKAGMINDFQTHFQLMTVPGQVFYEASRRSVIKGADGIVFVADSQVPLIDANLENFDNLRRHLQQHNVDLNLIPLVFQYNKRDLDNLIPVETFNSLLNPMSRPYIESAAINGTGVLETLKEIAKITVPWVREKIFGEARGEADKEE
ncbi:MAG: GTPase domain-containing protein, partial [Candidatus Aminicenantes bacterium]|nr:GTPase domain-containing protein [Candidatus Aminicenantes bacterium]